MAIAALPAVAGQLTPEQVERQLAALEKMADRAGGAGEELLHQLGLTKDEDYQGWQAIGVLAVYAYEKVATAWNQIAGSFVGTHAGLTPLPFAPLYKRPLPQETDAQPVQETKAEKAPSEQPAQTPWWQFW